MTLSRNWKQPCSLPLTGRRLGAKMARLSELAAILGCACQLLTYGEALFRSGSATALQGQLHALVIFSYWLLLAWAPSGPWHQ